MNIYIAYEIYKDAYYFKVFCIYLLNLNLNKLNWLNLIIIMKYIKILIFQFNYYNIC